MKRFLLLLGTLATAGLFLHDVSRAHGGSYRGPGDTVPPGGGGGGGGGSGPSVPGSGGPGTGPSGPTGPGGGGGVPTGPRGGSPAGVPTGAAMSGPDLTTWEFWWGFNKDQYLRLKEHLHAGGIQSGDGSFFEGTKAESTLRPSEATVRARIVPALQRALANERSNDIVTGALVALAKIGEQRGEDGASDVAPALAKFLADPNQEIAETAAVALGILASADAIEPLSQLALDTRAGRELCGRTEVPLRTRAFATYGLGLVGHEIGDDDARGRILRILIDVVNGGRTSTRDLHVAAITAMGLVPMDVDPGESPEGSSDPSSSRQAQMRFLRRALRSQDLHDLVRAHVPTALARLCDGAPAELRARVIEDLLPNLDEHATEKDEVVQSTVLALGLLGDADADPLDARIRAALVQSAKIADQQSRRFACIALGQIAGRAGDGADVEKGRAEVRRHLLDQLTKGKSSTRTWAALGLGVLENGLEREGVAGGSASGTTKEVLRKALADEVSPSAVGAYAIALGIAGDAEARAPLTKKFAAMSDPEARGYVAIALGLVGASDALSKVQEAVRESKYQPDLLKSAAIGLGLLGDKDLVPLLCDMLGEAKGLSSQASIASALGFIGDSRSVDPLVAMLEKKELSDSARGFAAVALGIVADKEALPWNAKLAQDANYRASTSTLTGENGTGVLDIL